MKLTLRPWWVVFVKEVKENLRDRRAVFSSLVMGAMLGPLFFALMINYMIKQQTDRAEQELVIPIAHAERAPNLVDWLQRQGAKIETAPEQVNDAVRQRDVDLVLLIPESYGEQWLAAEPAQLELIVDSSRRDVNTTVARVQGLVSAWGRQVGQLRLQVRGIDPKIANAIAIQSIDVSTPESRGGIVLGLWPYLLMLSVFAGGMYLAIDATAGERERQSMEPLLLNPITTAQVVAGKILATISFALLALALTLIVFRLGVNLLPVEDLGIRLHMGVDVLLSVFVLMIPVAVLAAGLQTLTAAFTKGYREAQTYLSFLLLLPGVPSIWLAIAPVKPDFWMMWVPLLNQSVLIQMLSRDESILWYWAVLAWMMTGLLAVLVAYLAKHFYQRPGIVG